jgi:hypothetical protein
VAACLLVPFEVNSVALENVRTVPLAKAVVFLPPIGVHIFSRDALHAPKTEFLRENLHAFLKPLRNADEGKV